MKILPPGGTPLRTAVEAINSLANGRSNAVRRVTLTPGATQTICLWDNINEDAEVFLIPRTANAAAALATTYATISRVSGDLKVTITHANAASTDRTFGVLVVGG